MKSSELLELLSKGHQPPTRAFIPEFRCGTGYSRETRADAISMGLWPSAKDGMEITGYELKISRADWLRELKYPNKADPIKQFCDRWYLVVSDLKIVTYIHELPDGWGLMYAENGEIRMMVEAKKLTPVPPDKAFIAALMRRATRVDGLAHLVPKSDDWNLKTKTI